MKKISILTLLFMSTASAQDSINTHGFYLSPSDGDVHDPLRTWRSESHEAKSFALDVVGEYSYRPLVRYSVVGDETFRTVEVQDFTAMNMGLFYAPHKRLALTATAPMFLSVGGDQRVSGAGLGDLRMSAPMTILRPEDSSVALSIVPHLDVPGFYDSQFFNSAGLSGGGVIAATMGSEDWQISGNFGGQFAPEVELENLSGNERLLAALTGSYSVTDDFAIRGELNLQPTLTKNDIPWTDTPGEFTLSAKGQADHRLGWVAGMSTALTRGVGASTFRAFLGANIAIGARDKSECVECPTVSMMYDVLNERGERVNSQIIIVDSQGQEKLSTSTDELGDSSVVFESEEYVVTITVPDCKKAVTVTDEEIILLQPIFFDFDKATIRFPESSLVLDELVETLKQHNELKLVEVAGHTDERGADKYNIALSKARVESVVAYLIERGVEESRLVPVGHGESQLLDDDCKDEKCHQLNRRVEFKILERE